MTDRTMTTKQVAQAIQRSPTAIYTALHRHPELRPSAQHGDVYQWTENDMLKLQNHFATAKRGRKAKRNE